MANACLIIMRTLDPRAKMRGRPPGWTDERTKKSEKIAAGSLADDGPLVR
jgi:hypothetical protein